MRFLNSRHTVHTVFTGGDLFISDGTFTIKITTPSEDGVFQCCNPSRAYSHDASVDGVVDVISYLRPEYWVK